ncbi:MAG: 30S ribosomal protein S20 [Erysipelotrichaceae bacterium]|nr:30S ribosomal protein S20 [Erysipelotrichaceae bacterium]
MPNIKSQKKRAITNLKENAAHKAEKSALKTSVKKVLKAVEAKDKDAAAQALPQAASLLDKSVTSGIHHKNYAARQKSRLTKAVNSL